MACATSYWLLLGFRVRVRVLPAQFRADRLPVRRRNHAPGARGDVEQPAAGDGPASGIVFIFGMDALKAPGSGAMTFPMVLLVVLTLVSVLLSLFLRDSGARLAGRDAGPRRA